MKYFTNTKYSANTQYLLIHDTSLTHKASQVRSTSQILHNLSNGSDCFFFLYNYINEQILDRCSRRHIARILYIIHSDCTIALSFSVPSIIHHIFFFFPTRIQVSVHSYASKLHTSILLSFRATLLQSQVWQALRSRLQVKGTSLGYR